MGCWGVYNQELRMTACDNQIKFLAPLYLPEGQLSFPPASEHLKIYSPETAETLS